MICQYCDNVNKELCVCVGRCTNRCLIYAHLECFQKRQTSPMWRKIHRSRDPQDSELCPIKGCCGKFIPNKTKNKQPSSYNFPHYEAVKEEATEQKLCCHLTKKGLPCRRPIYNIEHGVCKLHMKDVEATERLVQSMKTTKDASTQTHNGEDDTVAIINSLQSRIEELELTMQQQAEEHVTIIANTRQDVVKEAEEAIDLALKLVRTMN